MRILFLTETIPYPLDTGGRIKTYHALRMLQREHEVHCHAFIRDDAQRQHLAALQQVTASTTLHLLARSVAREAWYVARSVVSRAPYSVGRHFDSAACRAVAADAARLAPDLVHCDHLSMVEYRRRLGLPIVYDAHNVEHWILQRFASARRSWATRAAAAVEWRRVRSYERDACLASRLVFTVSDVDRDALAALTGPGVTFCPAPNAVDAAGLPDPPPPPRSSTVLFLGGLHWPPNADAVDYFVRDIWPTVRQARPDARLVAVGRDDGPVAAAIRQAPGVTLTGWVPDIEPYVRAARLLAVSMRAGSGMRVKILDALARGLPVVTTSVGCEGIDVVDGEHVLVADTAADFARAVRRVLDDDAVAQALAANGRRLALERYDVQVIERRVAGALRGVSLRQP